MLRHSGEGYDDALAKVFLLDRGAACVRYCFKYLALKHLRFYTVAFQFLIMRKTGIEKDFIPPRFKTCPGLLLKFPGMEINLGKCFLHHVFNLLAIPQDMVRLPIESVFVTTDEHRKKTRAFLGESEDVFIRNFLAIFLRRARFE